MQVSVVKYLKLVSTVDIYIYFYLFYRSDGSDLSSNFLKSNNNKEFNVSSDLFNPINGDGASSVSSATPPTNLWINRAKQLTDAAGIRKSSHTIPIPAAGSAYQPPIVAVSANSTDGLNKNVGDDGLKPPSSSSLPSPTIVNSWLANNLLRGVARQQIKDDIVIKSYAIKVVVADCYCILVNNEYKMIYKLAIHDKNNISEEESVQMKNSNNSNALCERSFVRIISKRLDELVYLRMQILSEYPHIPISNAPFSLPTASLNILLAHPLPGTNVRSGSSILRLVNLRYYKLHLSYDIYVGYP